jgi:hypothetical protein
MVIRGVIIAVALGMSGFAVLPEEPVVLPEKPVVPVRTKPLTLPQKCRHLLREPDPATWDEEKHEYPPNHAWEECMGVGRK